MLSFARSFVLAVSVPLAVFAAPPRTVETVQQEAARFHDVIQLPHWDKTPAEIQASTKAALAAGDQALDRIVKQDAAKLTFANTVLALDDATADVALAAARIGFLQNVSPDSTIRDAAGEAVKTLSQWGIGVQYREDLYRIIKAFADTNPNLSGEDKRLFDFTLRDYKRAGLSLPAADRAEVEQWRKELTAAETDFQANVVKTKAPLTFTKAQLAGVPEDFLKQAKTGDDAYTVMVNVTPQRLMVLENCSVAATRQKVTQTEYSMAKDINLPLITRMIELRNLIALKLGYASWADYRTEVKMALSGGRATKFVQDLVDGIEPKFAQEIAELQKLKAQETNDPKAKIELADWRYYQHQLVKQRYTIDTEALRVYFPFEQTLHGMFAIYEKLFGLKFEQVQPPWVWADGVTLWAVMDAKTGEPMGMFYLDMFPRDGKYNHFAEFPIQQGWVQPNGTFLRPVVSLVCNFNPPTADKPSLLDHQEVSTLFHEFGHCMHEILTEAKHARFAGTSVPGDFVEAPSQMLENWTYDKAVLDTFAADYRDPSKKVPTEILARMKEVRLATIGVFYRRQFAFGMMDLAVHGAHAPEAVFDTATVANGVMSAVFLPVPHDSAQIAYFAHLANGYDAGYYGYAWADAIAADMASVFEKSPNGFLDADTGMRLRNEIYSRGDSRDTNESIEKFLGRPQSPKAFLEKLGIKTK